MKYIKAILWVALFLASVICFCFGAGYFLPELLGLSMEVSGFDDKDQWVRVKVLIGLVIIGVTTGAIKVLEWAVGMFKDIVN